MNAFRDIIITGLLLGGIFALVSVGLSLQYGVARVLNVAHGEFIMVGAFITFWLLGAINLNPLLSVVVTGPAHLRDGCHPAQDPLPSPHGHLALARRLRGEVDARLVRAALRRAEPGPDHLGLGQQGLHLPEHDRHRCADPAQPSGRARRS